MTLNSSPGTGGGSQEKAWPPGFRFHPTDEELVLYYLKRKICKKRLRLNIIREVDVYKWDPEDLPGQSFLKTGDRQWFFFSPRDRKYPNAARSNRATSQGYWKATGKDRNITCNSRNVGVKKTLVFYRGRAPTGDRTDWVMHEYTMDEEELKRCPNLQDYYALYKVYKKSGPGPKNGEQYGAPFKEEEWLDDDPAHAPVKKCNDIAPVAKVNVFGPLEPPLNDLEEIMKQIVDEPLLNQPQHYSYNNVLSQVAGAEEAQSTLVNSSSREVPFPELFEEFTAINQQNDRQGSFDFNQSATSKLQLHEAPEVTSAPNNNTAQVPHISEEDFLEIDDLLGPEPTLPNNEKPVDNLHINDYDGLSVLDLYHDADMFLRDIGPFNQERISHSCMDSFGNGMVDQGFHQLQSNSVQNHVDVDFQFQHHAVVNNVSFQVEPHVGASQEDHQLQCNSVLNHVDINFQFENHTVVNNTSYQFENHTVVNNTSYQLEPYMGANQDQQLQPHSIGVNQLNNELWGHEQRNSVLTSSEMSYGGFAHESVNNSTGALENQNSKDGDAGGGWLSSALWSFVESIPTTPASAAESPLVNKAFERMSSFSRIGMMNAKNGNGNGDGVSCGRSGKRSRVFVILSVMGALFAILWVLMGTVRVLGRTISP